MPVSARQERCTLLACWRNEMSSVLITGLFAVRQCFLRDTRPSRALTAEKTQRNSDFKLSSQWVWALGSSGILLRQKNNKAQDSIYILGRMLWELSTQWLYEDKPEILIKTEASNGSFISDRCRRKGEEMWTDCAFRQSEKVLVKS